jgi:alpha-tubulin suppressor-like RCC1 family protein
MIIIARPSVLKFPRHTRPIKSIACGSAHCLALTDIGDLYTWGCGSYGAIGLGTRDDVKEPCMLQIKSLEGAYEKVT